MKRRNNILLKQDIVKKAKHIRLLAMDVDGVLTDGKIIIFNSGEEVKCWNVKDRIGFFMLHKTGKKFPVAWITGRKSKQVLDRSREIGTIALYQNCHHKGKALAEVMRKCRVTPKETLFIGDDWVDIPALRLAGLSVCPRDAHEEIRKICDYTTKASGGEGVFRETVDIVLKAQGLWKSLLKTFENPIRRPNP